MLNPQHLRMILFLQEFDKSWRIKKELTLKK